MKPAISCCRKFGPAHFHVYLWSVQDSVHLKRLSSVSLLTELLCYVIHHNLTMLLDIHCAPSETSAMIPSHLVAVVESFFPAD